MNALIDDQKLAMTACDAGCTYLEEEVASRTGINRVSMAFMNLGLVVGWFSQRDVTRMIWRWKRSRVTCIYSSSSSLVLGVFLCC